MSDIKVMRLGMGLTQVEFAKMLGVHPMTISHWERGVYKPNRWLQREIDKFEALKRKRL